MKSVAFGWTAVLLASWLAAVGQSLAISQGCSARTLRYDYIIVGGGTAGCVLANRLSADEKKRVLMLEAGTEPAGVEVAAPAALTKLFNSRFDWSFRSESEAAAGDRSIFLCRGKALGGSSNTNAMLYNRGSPQDFQAWEAAGGPDWSWENLLEFYKKHENFEGPASEFHGKGGPVNVRHSGYNSPISEAFLDSCEKLGYNKNDDFDDWKTPQEGYGRFRVTSKNGRRVSAHTAYLRPILGRKNLEVVTESRATRVLFEGDKAVGVEFSKVDSGEIANAYLTYDDRAEVLLSAGAVASPHLLMLSGIGPRTHLEDHGVKVIKDLPGVGRGLRDQPACLVSYNIDGKNSITDHLFRPKGGHIRRSTLLNFLVRGKGALTSPGCEQGGFFYSSSEAREAGKEPDLQLRFVPGRGDSDDGVQSYENLGKGGHVSSGITFQCIAVRPKSVGSIRLKSSNPLEAPAIATNFLDNEADMKTLRGGMRLSEKIARQGAIGKAAGGIGRRVFPSEVYGSMKFTSLAEISDKALDEYIRDSVHSANAVVGTCALDDVVDSELRVKGTSHLRVVDASIMPSLPGGQACSHVYMVAEKAADILLKKGEGAEKQVGLRPVELKHSPVRKVET